MVHDAVEMYCNELYMMHLIMINTDSRWVMVGENMLEFVLEDVVRVLNLKLPESRFNS